MIKKRLLLIICCSLLLVPGAAAQDMWELIWSDEFEYTGLPDATKWGYDVGVGQGGWGNNEEQYYTEARLENARVGNGVLTIEARKENFQGRQYTSARLVTRDRAEWTYGRFEVRADVPFGRGTWAAIWLLYAENQYGNGSWPDNGEIDFMEYVGHDQNRIHGTVHTDRFNSLIGTQRGSSIVIDDVENSFHVYAIEWTPRKIDFFVDDEKYFTYENDGRGWPSWPFDQPFYLILNLAIGGNWGGAQGIDDSIFPQQMQVDYVRVYRYAAPPQIALTDPTTAVSIAPGSPLPISVDASDSDGQVERVEILQGGGVMAEFTEPPYTLTLEDTQAGCYEVRARVVDDGGWTTETEAVPVTVGSDCPQAPYLIAPTPIPGVLEAEYYDLGGSGVAYLDVGADNSGSGIRQDEGVDIEVTSDRDGRYHVTNIANREWMEYTIDVVAAGTYTIDARIASETGGGSFRLEIDGEDKTGAVSFGSTGGLQQWDIVRVSNVTLDAGLQTLRVRMLSGGFNLNKLTFVQTTGTGVKEGEVPDRFNLLPNYPNPFNRDTIISYTLPEAAFVTLEVFDAQGRKIETLRARMHAPGMHEATFSSQNLPNGTYFYRLHTPTSAIVRPMTLMR